jgi:mannose/fructose/N-acetylgalactosamine-specific phosphotransferase system component IID
MKRIKGKQIIWGCIILFLSYILISFILNWEETKAGFRDGARAGSDAVQSG